MRNVEGGDDLLSRLRAGDEEAAEIFVRTHVRQAMGAALRLLHDEEEARDAVQEAFSRAFDALPGFRGEAMLSTWLHRIVINTALMRLRGRARRPEIPLEDLLPRFDVDGRVAAIHEEARLDAETVLLDAEARRRVRAAIGRLPADARAVLILRDIEDLSTAEAAAVLGVTPNAVKLRLHRARQALRSLVAGSAGESRAPARGLVNAPT